MIEENRGNGIWKEEGALTESTGTNRTRNRRRSGESLIKGGERKSYKEEEPHEGLTLLLHEGGLLEMCVVVVVHFGMNLNSKRTKKVVYVD